MLLKERLGEANLPYRLPSLLLSTWSTLNGQISRSIPMSRSAFQRGGYLRFRRVTCATHPTTVSREYLVVDSSHKPLSVTRTLDQINAWPVGSRSTSAVFTSLSADPCNSADSPHLREVSAPLAHAGTSILYQSSYFTDFLQVKEADFEKASSIFAQQGWHIDPGSLSRASHRRSQLLSPLSPSLSDDIHSYHSDPSPRGSGGGFYGSAYGSEAAIDTVPPEITVLSSPLACIGFSRTAKSETFEKIRQLVIWPRRAEISWKRRSEIDLAEGMGGIGNDLDTPPLTANDTTGTNDTNVTNDTNDTSDARGTTTPSETPRNSGFHSQANRTARPFLSYTRTTDGSSLISDLRILRDMFGKQNEGEVLELWNEVDDPGHVWESSDESTVSGWASASASDDDEGDGNGDRDEDDEDSKSECEKADGDLDDAARLGQVGDLEPGIHPATQAARENPARPRSTRSGQRPQSLPITPIDSQPHILKGDIPVSWTAASSPTSAITAGKDVVRGDKNEKKVPTPTKRSKASGRISWIESPEVANQISQNSARDSGQSKRRSRLENGNNEEVEDEHTKGQEEGQKGRKRCLQLDLRAVGEGGVFHMGRSFSRRAPLFVSLPAPCLSCHVALVISDARARLVLCSVL